MKLKTIGGLAGAMALSVGLAGCIDATVDVEVTSETTAQATVTQIMDADFYTMLKSTAEAEKSGTHFCDDGTLTEAGDGGAICVIASEGRFADLTFGEDQPPVIFTSEGRGLVRVAFSTVEMNDALAADGSLDPETEEMITAFFTGHTITLRVSGKEVVESNMTISGDGKAAEEAIPFADLINGKMDLPDELYAVIRTQ